MSSTEPGFFQRDGRRLFGVYHPPEGRHSGRAFLFCNGFAGEFLLVRSYFHRIAKEFSQRGHGMFRFDYTGYADSEGEFVDATVDSMSADIEQAIDEAKLKAKAKTVSLLGVRFGGMLAARVAASRDDVDRLILWDPVLSPWDYLYRLLRGTVAMQTVLFRGVRFNRDQIIENVMASKPSMADGYNMNVIDDGFPLSRELLRQAREVDLLSSPPALDIKTLIVHVRKSHGELPKPLAAFAAALSERGTACSAVVAVEPVMPWKHEGLFTTAAPDLCTKTLDWLES